MGTEMEKQARRLLGSPLSRDMDVDQVIGPHFVAVDGVRVGCGDGEHAPG